MYTLGINAAFHDTSACLVEDGKVLAAAEEERFTRIKHGKRPVPFSTWELPFHAIDYCLREAGIRMADVGGIGYSFQPSALLGSHNGASVLTLPMEPSAHPVAEEWLSVWDPLFLSSMINAPRHLVSGVPHHLGERWRGMQPAAGSQWTFVPHHLAHAASAYFPSPFEGAAVMTLDGRGERATTSYARGTNGDLEMMNQVDLPHSLGLLYENITSYLGFLHSSDEYKVMALASYGRPVYLDLFRKIIKVGENGAYTVEPLRLEEWFGPARSRGGPMERRHYDIAHSLQKALEETVLQLSRWLHSATESRNLCLAGGVALNCVLNSHIRDHGPFENIWVQPASGDAGTAVGAALVVDRQRNGPHRNRESGVWTHCYYGPAYENEEIEQFLRWSKVPYRRLANIAQETSALLAEDRIIGWFQGRMEFGPRALGARSILASPIHADMQARLNEIKDREDFRPVAPVVLEEKAHEWFEGAQRSPFMLFVNNVKPDKADLIPAVRHVDGTARIQTVNGRQHPLLHELLLEFEKRTGVPVLVNTSFNTRGEPIVCSPRDAVECFWTSPLDALIIGSFCVEKPVQTV
jgi:carbamoyltransferase